MVASDSAITIIPDGWYNAFISEIDPITPNPTTGVERFNVNYEIQDGDFKGAKVKYDNFTLSEKAMWKLSALARALGHKKGEKINIDEFHDKLLGKSLKIRVAQEPSYTDPTKKYAKVKDYAASELNDVTMDINNFVISDEDLSKLF